MLLSYLLLPHTLWFQSYNVIVFTLIVLECPRVLESHSLGFELNCRGLVRPCSCGIWTPTLTLPGCPCPAALLCLFPGPLRMYRRTRLWACFSGLHSSRGSRLYSLPLSCLLSLVFKQIYNNIFSPVFLVASRGYSCLLYSLPLLKVNIPSSFHHH